MVPRHCREFFRSGRAGPEGVGLDPGAVVAEAGAATTSSGFHFAKGMPCVVVGDLGGDLAYLAPQFATARHIAVDDLKEFAAKFSAWSGESYPLAA
ncbi:hypothetical protein MesoLj131b_74150 (plasmid) [Mesorhizobium sp. 131-2-5]|uniref:hypothetical protein n=1 Tax=Mesorhizobium sp. 131-2-5 TaxID=2744519 RepID=UPI0018EB5871|nr:hypothetical protein [Mesorhizobium sp. 131-2-5]BCH05416.1 hypothetical protein MesoLj131b_74150 [Mesorhizobium sp. 131-2-5]